MSDGRVPDYGEPGRHDPASDMERMVMEVAEEIARTVREVGPSVINRQPGDRSIPRSEQALDFMRVRDDPQKLGEMIQSRAETLGVEGAVEEFVDWYTKMMARTEGTLGE